MSEPGDDTIYDIEGITDKMLEENRQIKLVVNDYIETHFPYVSRWIKTRLVGVDGFRCVMDIFSPDLVVYIYLPQVKYYNPITVTGVCVSENSPYRIIISRDGPDGVRDLVNKMLSLWVNQLKQCNDVLNRLNTAEYNAYVYSKKFEYAENRLSALMGITACMSKKSFINDPQIVYDLNQINNKLRSISSLVIKESDEILFPTTLIDNAIKLFHGRHRDLLVNDLHEITIAHHLAICIERFIEKDHFGYDVDIEYNRNCTEIKMINGKLVRPDIIVHVRGKYEHNLLLVEIGKGDSSETMEDFVDRGRRLRYKFAAKICIKNKSSLVCDTLLSL